MFIVLSRPQFHFLYFFFSFSTLASSVFLHYFLYRSSPHHPHQTFSHRFYQFKFKLNPSLLYLLLFLSCITSYLLLYLFFSFSTTFSSPGPPSLQQYHLFIISSFPIQFATIKTISKNLPLNNLSYHNRA